MVWLLLGSDLAYHKAQFGPKVNWIGYVLQREEALIRAIIKESFMHDFAKSTTALMNGNVIKTTALRKYTGQANHVAGLLFGWRPSLDTRWAALHPSKSAMTNAPKHFVWAKQVRSPLDWLDLFLKRRQGSLSRLRLGWLLSQVR